MTTKGLPYYVTEKYYQLEDKPNQIELETSFDDYYENIFTTCMKKENPVLDGVLPFRDKSKPLKEFCVKYLAIEIQLNNMTAAKFQRAYDALMYELKPKTSII